MSDEKAAKVLKFDPDPTGAVPEAPTKGRRVAQHLIYSRYPEIDDDEEFLLGHILVGGQFEEYERRCKRLDSLEREDGRPITLAEQRLLSVPLGDALRTLFKHLQDNYAHENVAECWIAAREWMLRGFRVPFDGITKLAYGEGIPRDLFLAANAMAEAQWACDAFPTIQIDSKTAAALLGTRQDEMDHELRTPWHSFVIEVQDDGTCPLDRVMLSRLDVLVQPFGFESPARAHSCVTLGRHTDRRVRSFIAGGQALTELGSLTIERLVETLNTMSCDVDEEDLRLQVMACRIAYGVCACMQSPSAVVKKSSRGKLVKIQPGGEMRPGSYVVGLPVKVDLRKEARDWVTGKATKFCRNAIRWLVHGHWRKQACGVGLRDRKTIWIEAYWKGPERAAALVRPHVLGSAEKDVSGGGEA